MPSMEVWDPHVRTAVNTIQRQFGVRGGTYNGHQPRAGLAADFVVSKTTGDKLAPWLKAHAQELHVEYVIWYRHIWNIRRDAEGWRPYSGTPNPHTDHVHVPFLPAGRTIQGDPDINTDTPISDSSNSDQATIASSFQSLSDPLVIRRILLIIIGIILILVGLYRVAKVDVLDLAEGFIGEISKANNRPKEVIE